MSDKANQPAEVQPASPAVSLNDSLDLFSQEYDDNTPVPVHTSTPNAENLCETNSSQSDSHVASKLGVCNKPKCETCSGRQFSLFNIEQRRKAQMLILCPKCTEAKLSKMSLNQVIYQYCYKHKS